MLAVAASSPGEVGCLRAGRMPPAVLRHPLEAAGSTGVDHRAIHLRLSWSISKPWDRVEWRVTVAQQ